ncbi:MULTISPECIES: phosphatase PAP2 family protein [unclassified Thermococcus]|uniref:phosphatase PAP2 family protein n=1 Tax=unclassified Thermococcus TaxID=2627626 RepID=UPI001F0D7048|nr:MULTISPECIES: phosphatase PAP2 family protein [unclassified Thermococcus]
MPMNERRKLGILTGMLIVIFIAQLLGLLGDINTYVYAHTPFVDSLWITLITDSASFGIFAVYVLLFVLWDLRRSRKLSRSTLNFIVSIFLGMAIVGVLKVLTEVPRPDEAPLSLPFFQALLNADYFAFPSGHTARASILACFLGERFPKYKLIWWGYALLVAFSRLLFHVHWFSDVLFSLILGPWVFIVVASTESMWLPIYRAFIEKLKLEVFDVE